MKAWKIKGISAERICAVLRHSMVEIKIRDNGNVIPSKVLNQIFQPFFTTKPTGQGTVLGLSLAYDIVKAHGGELKAETTEGDGAKFIVSLPM
jgi:signal transduction histidine kinase